MQYITYTLFAWSQFIKPVLSYPNLQPTYPNYIETSNGSASASFGAVTSKIRGSYKQLGLYLTNAGDNATFWASIADTTWNASFYNDTINSSSPPVTQTRNVTIFLQLQDGNYTSSIAQSFQCDGRFFPQAQRGVADCVFSYGFGSPEFKDNETELKNQALNLTNEWPNSTQYAINSTADSSKLLMNCKAKFYYTLSLTNRVNSNAYVYPPDTELRRSWHKDSQGSSLSGYVLVPSISSQFISQDCGFQINMSSQVNNDAVYQKNGLVFFAIIVFVDLALVIASIKMAVDTSDEQIKQMGFPALSFHLNSQYLVTILFIIGNGILGGTLNIQAFLAFLSLMSLFPLVLRVTTVMLASFQQQQLTMIGALFKITGLVMSTIGPSIIIMIISFFIPFLATQILVIICCSYLFVGSVFKFIKGDGKPAFPLYFVIINIFEKTLYLSYIFGIDNAYDLQPSTAWFISIISLMAIQLVFYLFQVKFGPRLCLKFRNKNIYNYDRPLTAQITQQLKASNKKQDETDILIAFERPNLDRNSEKLCAQLCCNPAHAHQRSVLQSTIESIKQIPELTQFVTSLPLNLALVNAEQSTNCLTYIKKDTLDQFVCPICFDELDVQKSNDGLFVRLFKRQYKKHYEYESLKRGQNYIQERVFVTPCGHVFHEECLKKWLEENAQCPVDRRPLLQPE